MFWACWTRNGMLIMHTDRGVRGCSCAYLHIRPCVCHQAVCVNFCQVGISLYQWYYLTMPWYYLVDDFVILLSLIFCTVIWSVIWVCLDKFQLFLFASIFAFTDISMYRHSYHDWPSWKKSIYCILFAVADILAIFKFLNNYFVVFILFFCSSSCCFYQQNFHVSQPFILYLIWKNKCFVCHKQVSPARYVS